jgi:hypothetical protein
VIIAYKNGAPVRIRDIGVPSTGRRTTRSARAYRQGGRDSGNGRHHPAADLPSSRAPTSSRRSTRSRRRCRKLQAAIPPAIKVDTTAPDHPRLGRRRRVHAAADHRAGGAGDLPVPAQRRATLIPSVTVPLSLIGTFGVMYLLGYSLDNLSLMALTIAVGFVVDDAIVMLENIVPLHRGGHEPDGGGAEGRGRDRLHHHLDHGVADRGVHPAAADGRHRRPAVPRVRGHGDADHRWSRPSSR